MNKKSPRENARRLSMREERMKKQRQQRTIVFVALGIIVLVVLALAVYPSIRAAQQANAPAADFIKITPHARPNAQGTAMGDPNAPVRIDVFEDYQCPACAVFTQEVESKIVRAYVESGKVYYVFNQYPFLDTGNPLQESHKAANASMCANEQGRFWDYHDLVYVNQSGENAGHFSDKLMTAFAESLGLDMQKFNACYSAKIYEKDIENSVTKGNQMGVQGTPSVFVNGTIVKPGYIPQFEDIQAVVEPLITNKK